MVWIALGLGLLHGLGPDHLVAITALISRDPDPRRAALYGVRFGLGHMGTLTVFGLAGLVLKVAIPGTLERLGEVLGGVLLVMLGIMAAYEALLGHRHPHSHLEGTPAGPQSVSHSHWHRHPFGAHPGHGDEAQHARAHNHGPTALLVGGLFALSGLRSLLLMLPLTLAASTLSTMAGYILIFGLGIVLSMGVYGWLAAQAFTAAARTHPALGAARTAAGLLSVAVGVYWVVSHW